jgi:hypothetical protein
MGIPRFWKSSFSLAGESQKKPLTAGDGPPQVANMFMLFPSVSVLFVNVKARSSLREGKAILL